MDTRCARDKASEIVREREVIVKKSDDTLPVLQETGPPNIYILSQLWGQMHAYILIKLPISIIMREGDGDT